MKFPKILIIALTCATVFSCNNPTASTNESQQVKDTTVVAKKNIPAYNSIKFVDDFISANSDAIKRNTALKEQKEALCTKQLLPLIDKNGLYDDLPFVLTGTITNDGTAYGNFIYEDNHHFVKATCILKEKQVANLKENDKYLIKFKVVKFADAISFNGETGKIELPTVDAKLISFTPYQK